MRAITLGIALLGLLTLPAAGVTPDARQPFRVGSKTFTESYVLGEIVAQLLENRGLAVQRELGLGGTLVAYEALRAGSIDVYPDYTGTLAQAVLQRPELSSAELAAALAARGLRMPVALGFDNSYAIAVREGLARELGITRISDLARHAQLRAVFSHEFLNRSDGWAALRSRYQLPQDAQGIEHALAYDALENGRAALAEPSRGRSRRSLDRWRRT